MVFGKLGHAVSDLTETLRRVFQSPPTLGIDPAMDSPGSAAMPLLQAEARGPEFVLLGRIAAPPLALAATAREVPTRFEGALKAEDGWARWASGATVFEMGIFARRERRELEIPALPRRAVCRRVEAAAFQARSRANLQPLPLPGVRGGAPSLGTPVCRKALDLALGLPIAIQGQQVQDLPKPQWMRYSLQLVKATGENIRNLEVMGIYRIPSKGVAAMKHDSASGRLLLELTREAAGARRQPFLLARRKDDRSLVSCFLEEG